MKIVSFNTAHCQNYVTKKIDYQLYADVIGLLDPDIIGLNEMRSQGSIEGYEYQTEKLSELTGMKNYYFAKAIDVMNADDPENVIVVAALQSEGDVNPYGNALLSKLPIESAQTIYVPNPLEDDRHGEFDYEPRCLLKARLEGGITVLVIHFGLNPEEHLNAVKTVLENLESEKCILMGDFNVEPDSEVLNPIRERMKDASEAFKMPRKSWPAEAPERKIDYIFVSPDVEVVSADIPGVIASDHRPHTAEINIK